MTEKPPPSTDYDALAKRYLDLWQEQVAKLAKDPGQLGGAAAAWSQMATSMMQNAAQPFSQPGTAYDRSSPPPAASGSTSRATSGSASSGPAHGPGGMDIADVLRRLDVLEKRLAALESIGGSSADSEKPSQPAARPRGGSGQRKSAATKLSGAKSPTSKSGEP